MNTKQTELQRLARALFDVAPFRDAEGSYEEQSPAYQALCERYVRAVVEGLMWRAPAETELWLWEILQEESAAPTYGVHPEDRQ